MESFDITRIIFLKTLAVIYFCGFANVINQYLGLLGEKGLLPISHFIKQIPWKRSPSLFYIRHSDFWLKVGGWTGLILALTAILGFSEKLGYFGHFFVWGLMWGLYLSYVNVGQVFYGFGWETLLLETGFLAIFFPPDDVATPLILIWLVRWILFRVMFGAGLIKLRGDKCWWDLTCLSIYYETQPMPNPLSWFFHRLPMWVHKTGVAFTHFAELIVPWGVFFPGIIGIIAGILTILLQLMIIVSGNLSWLNYITIVLSIACFNDGFWQYVFHMDPIAVHSASTWYLFLVGAYTLLIAYRSWEPIKNLISSGQIMNHSFDPWHLVNTYGAFGSITKRRFEIIFEGTDNPEDPNALWKEYEFKGKPGDIYAMPPLVAPYHYRLDWLMWFAAMGSYRNHPWTVHLLKKLLLGEKTVTELLKNNPFKDQPPKSVRAELYSYHFTGPKEKGWWTRKRVGVFLHPMSLDDDALQDYCKAFGWD
ncbi:MAG: lipase maturation factor family protein [Parachlamydiales bacterium]|jgi:hypothetical protein